MVSIDLAADWAPSATLDQVTLAQARFDAAVASLTDVDVHAPSPLPDWTVGHVLAHIARNADSHTRRIEAAQRGRLIDQYPGGANGRAAEIERDAHRSASELIDDVYASARTMDRAFRSVRGDAWMVESRDATGTIRRLRELPSRRWQEVEVHLLDLGLGHTPKDWPDGFVAAFLPVMRVDVADRLAPDVVAPPAGSLKARDELAWLYGRLSRPELPVLSPWD